MKTKQTNRGKVIVRFGGGLGNQLNNYAVAARLAHESGRRLFKDPSEYLLIRNRKYQLEFFTGPQKTFSCGRFLTIVFLIARVMERLHFRCRFPFLRLFGMQWYASPGVGLDADFSSAAMGEAINCKSRTIYLSGCCHDMRTFAARDELLAAFQPVCPVAFAPGDDSISLHIRRGDYIDWKWALGDVYYRRAIEKMRALVSNPKWYVFSDDIEWCQRHFGDLENAVFMKGDVDHSWRDLIKMSKCQHHVIANSTFSWWGAYLSERKGWTICPDPWLDGVSATPDVLVPKHWLPIASR